MKYAVCSGSWWSPLQNHPGTKFNDSWDFVRDVRFFSVWHYFVNKYTCPEKILIVDSDSPLKPEFPRDPRLEFIRMRTNFGHALSQGVEVCGWTRALMTGAFYTWINDLDYFVFIEQDCLVSGSGWVEHVISNMKGRGLSCGVYSESHLRVENSLIIIHRDWIPRFIRYYTDIPQWDSVLFPELKFHKLLFTNRFFKIPFTPLPFGYGRSRPIDFTSPHFYAQQWNESDLRLLLNQEGCEFLLPEKKESAA